MRVAVAADHGGFDLKAHVVELLRTLRHEPSDLGADRHDPADDYPDFAERAGRAIAEGRAERAIVLCGSGVGAAIAANKIVGVRACVCHDTYSARQAVEHDDLNTLCLGARVIGPETAAELVRTFLAARFSGEARHRRRLAKVQALEQPK